MQNILPNLKKMTFVDQDQHKFLDLEMDKYMVAVKYTEDGLTHLVTMELARGLDNEGLFSLIYMPHLGLVQK